MIVGSLIKSLGKIFGIICLFFLISGAYFLLKPTQEEKYLGQQMQMYPFGFHCRDDDGGEQVLKFDSKSQVAVYKDIYKYSMGKALYHGDEKKPFGCELLLTGNGEKIIVMVYLSDDGPVNLEDVRYEQCNDKDLIYEVVGKSLKKNKANIRYRNMGGLMSKEITETWEEFLERYPNLAFIRTKKAITSAEEVDENLVREEDSLPLVKGVTKIIPIDETAFPRCLKMGTAMEMGIWAASICEKNGWKVNPAYIQEVLKNQEEILAQKEK